MWLIIHVTFTKFGVDLEENIAASSRSVDFGFAWIMDIDRGVPHEILLAGNICPIILAGDSRWKLSSLLL